MAAKMSVGTPVSLAPPVLASIYQGLGAIATHPDGPISAVISYPMHFLLIWLGSYFPGLYLQHGPKGCKMAWEYLIDVVPIDLKGLPARHFFTRFENMYSRPYSFTDQTRSLIDQNNLLKTHEISFLISICRGLLPLRQSNNQARVEHYNACRFAKFFGFDQAVPTSFNEIKRGNFPLGQLRRIWERLLRSNTGVSFIMPGGFNFGQITHKFVRWWKICWKAYFNLQSREKLLIDPKINEIYTAQAVARIASSKVSKKRKNLSVGMSSSAQVETQEAEIILSPRRVSVNISEMLEPIAWPKENSSSSTDSFDSYKGPMKHHRTYGRSSSPPLEVLKQTDVVEGADNELLDYGEQEDDHIDYDLYIDLPEVIGFSTQAVPFSFVATEKFTDLPAVNLTPGGSSSAQVDTSFVDRNITQQEFVGDGDNVIFYDSSASLGASLKGKDGTQENFPADKEDLIPEAVGTIPSEDISVDCCRRR